MARRSDNLRYEAKALVKELVWFATNHHRHGDERDILLFATRRGGSTWLMEIIAANRGIKFLDQPFSTLAKTVTASSFRLLPRYEEGEVVHVDPEQEERMRAYVDAMLAGDLTVNAPTKFWRRDFHFRTDRLLLKIVAAKAIIDWLDDNYDVDIVYLTRHPIPQALSCIRNGWTLTVTPFLNNRWFVEHHLADGRYEYAQDVLRGGTRLERFVLNWVLENLVPLQLLPQRPAWLHVSYEECLLRPHETIARVGEALHLTDPEAMHRKLNQPSRSAAITTDETRALIESGDPEAILGQWRRFVDDDDERRAFAVLDRFDIDLYRPGSLVPTDQK